jgi:hypothetical protein
VVRAVDGTGFMGAVVEDTEEEGVEIGDGWGEGHQVFRVAQTGREGGGRRSWGRQCDFRHRHPIFKPAANRKMVEWH